MFYFTLLLLEPKQDQEKISREKMSIDELKKFSNYLEEQTTKGIPVKARISIYDEETKKGSIALSTNRDGTDVLEILLARVSQPEILRYLLENRGKQSSPTTSAKKVEEAMEEQEEEPDQSFQDSQEMERVNDRLETKCVFEEERHELSRQNERQITKKPTKTRTKEISNSKSLTAEWKNKYVLVLAGLVLFLFLLNSFLFWKQSMLVNKLETWQTKAEKEVTLVEKQPKIDTTSRFFLASYFSQAKEMQYKEGLKKFVGTSVEKWERPSGELNSMFLYVINEEKKGIEVNYILTISEEKTTQIKKISFYMKEKDGTILVVSQPKIEDFSW
ncbi:hypothetical protein GVK96_01155 [Enterococcus hirae]|uniref:hypothetical protein n=1 Tax=Enterococcus hirae TaxID=1354 RepID=UPI0013774E65|nr:hypothetical protein [Enterococcus hirae]NBA38128.1 hypothetical protein [Enterococcus hirae]